MNSQFDSIFETSLSNTAPEPFWSELNTSTIIYGTGTVGKDVYRILLEKGIPILGFMDHREREEKHIYSIPVFQPDDVLIPNEQRANVTVVIAIHNRDAKIADIIEYLKTLGYHRVVNLVEFHHLFGAELPIRYWLTSPHFYHSRKAPIASVYNLLSDDISRNSYLAILRFRLTGDYSCLPAPDMQHQYFPPDLPAWQTPLRLIDCGAYDGDTLSSFIKQNIPIQSVAAFEPDQENFKKLARFAQENKKNLPESYLWPCGVSHSTEQLSFEIGQGEASSVSSIGNSIIQCVSLDEALPVFAPNLIKMDIEGAEYNALLGAHRMIATHRPGLAISVYHRPEHLWQIPLLIAQIAQSARLNYHYGLRLHAQNGFDTIFYAIPER